MFICLRRLPRPCRGRWKAITALVLKINELRIRQAPADNPAKRHHESTPVAVLVLALVESERLLVTVTKQMERFDVSVGAFERPLKQRPKVFEAVGMNVAVNVALHVIDNLAVVIAVKIVVRHKRVGANPRTGQDVFADVAAKLGAARGVDHFENHAGRLLALAALKDALNGRLGDSSVANLRSAALVHVTGLRADVGFVGFADAAEFIEIAVLHRQPEAVQHEPRGFLSHAKGAVKLAGANAVLRVDDQPSGGQPFGEAKGRILEDRPDLGAELLLAALAVPDPARLDVLADLFRAAAGTLHAVRPAHRRHEGVARLFVGEKASRVDQSFGQILLIHALNLAGNLKESSI